MTTNESAEWRALNDWFAIEDRIYIIARTHAVRATRGYASVEVAQDAIARHEATSEILA